MCTILIQVLQRSQQSIQVHYSSSFWVGPFSLWWQTLARVCWHLKSIKAITVECRFHTMHICWAVTNYKQLYTAVKLLKQVAEICKLLKLICTSNVWFVKAKAVVLNLLHFLKFLNIIFVLFHWTWREKILGTFFWLQNSILITMFVGI